MNSNDHTLQGLLQEIAAMQNALRSHPMEKLIGAGRVPKEILDAFAHLHYLFSTNWGPVLGTMLASAKNQVFRAALEENMKDELGLNGNSHVMLCANFLRSQGLIPSYGPGANIPSIAAHPVAMMNAVAQLPEAAVAGYLLCAESLVPRMFSLFLPAFKARNADTRYLEEHLEVDEDKHSKMLQEAVVSILGADDSTKDIEYVDTKNVEMGILLGGRSIVCQADYFYLLAINIQPK